MSDFKTRDSKIINEGSDLDTIKNAIQNKIIGGMTIQLGEDKGGWLDFIDTDIGKVILQNQHLTFKDLNYPGNRTKGAFIKLDENNFAQITLAGSGRDDKNFVHIEIFPREEVKNRIHMAYFSFDRPGNKLGKEEALFGLKDFEIEETKGKQEYEASDGVKNKEKPQLTPEQYKDKKNMRKILSKIKIDDLEDPDIMLPLIEEYPEIFKVFKEENDYTTWSGEKNIYEKLVENQHFKESLFQMYKKLIENSKIQEHYMQDIYSRKSGYKSGYTFYTFEPNSPMDIFEGKMSDETREELNKIVMEYYKEQQKENPQFSDSQLEEICSKVSRGRLADAVIFGREHMQEKAEILPTAETLGQVAAENTRLERVNGITKDIKEASKTKEDRTQEGYEQGKY